MRWSSRLSPLFVLAMLLPAARATAQDGIYAREAVIAGPPSLVWRLLTTEQGIESWLVAQADVDLRVGGLVRTHLDAKGLLGDPETAISRVLSLEKGKRFTVKVVQTPRSYPLAGFILGTSYEVSLDPLPGNRTRVRCVGSGLTTGMMAYAVRPMFNEGIDLAFDHLNQAVTARADATKHH